MYIHSHQQVKSGVYFIQRRNETLGQQHRLHYRRWSNTEKHLLSYTDTYHMTSNRIVLGKVDFFPKVLIPWARVFSRLHPFLLTLPPLGKTWAVIPPTPSSEPFMSLIPLDFCSFQKVHKKEAGMAEFLPRDVKWFLDYNISITSILV